MNLSSFLLCLFFSELLVSYGCLSSSALISKYEDESNGPDFADLKRRLENELIVEEAHRHLEGDVSPVGIETEVDRKNKKKDKKDKKKDKKDDKKDKKSKGSDPQVPSTSQPSKAPSNSKVTSNSTQPPSEALLFLTDYTIDQAISDWIEGSNSRNSTEEKYGPIDKWDVSRVTNMFQLFHNHDFDGDISEWDVSQVTDMYSMFRDSSFNGDVSQWNVSKVTDMNGMFEGSSSFNGDVSQWDVSQVTSMYLMFYYSSVDQQLCWDISKVTDTAYMFDWSKGCIKNSCCVNCTSTLLCD